MIFYTIMKKMVRIYTDCMNNIISFMSVDDILKKFNYSSVIIYNKEITRKQVIELTKNKVNIKFSNCEFIDYFPGTKIAKSKYVIPEENCINSTVCVLQHVHPKKYYYDCKCDIYIKLPLFKTFKFDKNWSYFDFSHKKIHSGMENDLCLTFIYNNIMKKFNSDGDMYIGEYYGKNANGKGKFTYSDGDTYEGNFCMDEICGKGIVNGKINVEINNYSMYDRDEKKPWTIMDYNYYDNLDDFEEQEYDIFLNHENYLDLWDQFNILMEDEIMYFNENEFYDLTQDIYDTGFEALWNYFNQIFN